MMEEAFRGLRTNMLFMLGASQRVVLFTSTQPGEGKSFIAGNTEMCIRDRAYTGGERAAAQPGGNGEQPEPADKALSLIHI